MKKLVIGVLMLSFSSISFAENQSQVVNVSDPARDLQIATIISQINVSKLGATNAEIIRDTLARLGRIQGAGATPLYQNVFSLGDNLDGVRLLKWLATHVNEINSDPCKTDEVACTVPGSRILRLNPQWIDPFYFPLLVKGIIHEAGHQMYPGPHIVCNGSICDKDVQSAYGVATVVMANIVKYCTNCSKEETSDFADFAVEDAFFRLAPDSSVLVRNDMLSCRVGEVASGINKGVKNDLTYCRSNSHK